MVPFRLLVTYAGQGTELLPDKAADRTAFINGKPNEKIVKDRSLKFLSSGILLFFVAELMAFFIEHLIRRWMVIRQF